MKLLETICHSSCLGASWGWGQWGSRMHDPDAGARAPSSSHGARVVFTCSKKGPCPGEVPVQPGQAEAMGQCPVWVSSICHCPVTSVPYWPWACLSHFQQPLGSGEHLGNSFSWKKKLHRKRKRQMLWKADIQDFFFMQGLSFFMFCSCGFSWKCCLHFEKQENHWVIRMPFCFPPLNIWSQTDGYFSYFFTKNKPQIFSFPVYLKIHYCCWGFSLASQTEL